MLTFEKILQVFEDILRQDPLYEVVSTSHGYTLLAWDAHRNQWYSAELLETPDAMLDALLGVYSSYLESELLGNERDDLTAQEEEKINARCRQLREICLSE
ncbi:MAG: hypothetical protein ACI4EX_08255 [Lachnospiraceae bacterium]